MCPQAESWINEKLQVANDKSFQDPTNLENKLQRHQEFVAEVNANESRIQNIAKVLSTSIYYAWWTCIDHDGILK